MSLAEVLISKIGPAIGNRLFQYVWQQATSGPTSSEQIADTFEAQLAGELAQSEARRQFDKIGQQIAQDIHPPVQRRKRRR